MEKRASSNSAAKLYDQTRPSYPDEVIDDIIEHTDIDMNDPLRHIMSRSAWIDERDYASWNLASLPRGLLIMRKVS